MLRHEVAKRGILSLAERWNCPLMWSHYAQQHEGVCLEFSTPENVARNLLRVRYGADRSIPLSELYAWKVEHNADARERVLNLAFLSKAQAWEYEREWRILSRSEEHTSELQSLMRISYAVFCLKQKIKQDKK